MKYLFTSTYLVILFFVYKENTIESTVFYSVSDSAASN